MTHQTDRGYKTNSPHAGASWSETGGWLVDTARRNPEALLVLAAGLTLLMRGGGRIYRSGSSSEYEYDASDRDHVSELYREHDAEHGHGLRGSVTSAAREASGYAAETADRVYESATSYAASVSSYAEERARSLARQAEQVRNQAGQMLHEQPLAVAALGLVTGAAVAALLPPTQVEQRTFRPARDSLWNAATRTAETVMDAAAETATRTQEEAAKRGLSAEGLKEMARDAGETFTSKVTGSSAGTGGSTSGGSGASSAGASGGRTAGSRPATPGKGGSGAGGPGAGGSGPGGSGAGGAGTGGGAGR